MRRSFACIRVGVFSCCYGRWFTSSLSANPKWRLLWAWRLADSIRDLAGCFTGLKFPFVKRRGNHPAHCLTTLWHSLVSFKYWSSCIPSHVLIPIWPTIAWIKSSYFRSKKKVKNLLVCTSLHVHKYMMVMLGDKIRNGSIFAGCCCVLGWQPLRRTPNPSGPAPPPPSLLN